jgi:prepilin peptidase CpaA
MTFPALHLLPLGLCLLAATVWDVVRRRIPNAVVAIAALSGLVVQIVDRGFLAAASGLGAAVIVIALLYRPWMARGIGGGDVKLAAATAIWVGLAGMVKYALGVAIVGGLVAAIVYLLSPRSIKREIKANLTLALVEQSLPPVPQREPRRHAPYGLAISAGAIVALWGS